MAKILNDQGIKNLLGTIIIDGDDSCVKPNAYVLRLGGEGEFMNTGKDFKIGGKKKGIRVPPGHSVGITAFETLDFRQETVDHLYPGKALHGILSPVTHLSREGISAPTTQIDAGYNGTLNWTLVNTSGIERNFIYGEEIYRLTILILDDEEKPENFYSGIYQSKTGYVRSERRGAPTGTRDSEWENAFVEGGPEALLEDLIKSGYPWSILGTRLKGIDGRLQEITNEYDKIYERQEESEAKILRALKEDVSKEIGEAFRGEAFQEVIGREVRKTLKEESASLQNRWLLGIGSLFTIFSGAGIAILTNDWVLGVIKEHGSLLGGMLILLAMGIFWVISKQK